MSANTANQETEGLLSPAIRSVRLKQAAALIAPGSLVVDLACGGGFLRKFLPPGCRYFGVDRIPPSRPENFDAFLLAELQGPGFFERLEQWLPQPADVVTMLAFVEHIKAPEIMLSQVKRILKENGRVVLTTPHPVGRKLHDWLAHMQLCSSSAAAEHERFFDRPDLEKIAALAGYSVVNYRRFLLGLNQILEIRKKNLSPAEGRLNARPMPVG